MRGAPALLGLSVLAAVPALAAEPPRSAAELRALGRDGAEMRARIAESANDGYRLTIRCESGCARPVTHEEAVPNTPLGLFQIWDGDGLLLSTWTAASVYVVRVHLLTPTGVRRVLETGSRGAPGFALDTGGRMTITTSERTGGPADPLRVVTWTWDGARFLRDGRPVP